MRVISVSVNGIQQAGQRGLFDWLAGQDAEIICLQDLRARAYYVEDSPEFQLDGYSGYFFDSVAAFPVINTAPFTFIAKGKKKKGGGGVPT